MVGKPINMRYLVDIFVKKVNSNFNYAKELSSDRSTLFRPTHPDSSDPPRVVRTNLIYLITSGTYPALKKY